MALTFQTLHVNIPASIREFLENIIYQSVNLGLDHLVHERFLSLFHLKTLHSFLFPLGIPNISQAMIPDNPVQISLQLHLVLELIPLLPQFDKNILQQITSHLLILHVTHGKILQSGKILFVHLFKLLSL